MLCLIMVPVGLRGEDHSTYLEPMIVTRSIQFWDGIFFSFSNYFLMICCVLVVNYNLYYWKQLHLDNIQICKSATLNVHQYSCQQETRNTRRKIGRGRRRNEKIYYCSV